MDTKWWRPDITDFYDNFSCVINQVLLKKVALLFVGEKFQTRLKFHTGYILQVFLFMVGFSSHNLFLP